LVQLLADPDKSVFLPAQTATPNAGALWRCMLQEFHWDVGTR